LTGPGQAYEKGIQSGQQWNWFQTSRTILDL
jgi:hypothetical protein